MQSPSEREDAFAAALADPEAGAPAGIAGPGATSAQYRFAVYRNNVAASLSAALAAAFPVVERIVGVEFFRVMARAYALAEPPRSPILLDYGEGFAGFIDAFVPATSLPYLADVARIERAWREAYHAEDAEALDAAALARIPNAADLARSGFRLHPSLRIVRSRFPALTIWRMNAGSGPVTPVALDTGGEDALIVRPAAEVRGRLMPPGGAAFAAVLLAGSSVAAATQEALAVDRRFNLAANISGLVAAGAIVEVVERA